MSPLVFVLGLAVVAAGCLGSVKSDGGGGGGSGGGSAGSGGGSAGGGGSGSGNDGGTSTSDGGSIVLGNQLCEATLSIAGTFVQGDPPPSDLGGGCWPDGLWTFTATMTDNGGCPTLPTIPPQFQYKVVQDDDFNDTITYLTDPTNIFTPSSISGGDGALCVGEFIIYSSDGKSIFNLRPALQADNSLDGQGDWRLYDSDQRN
jgi:hypothetical protein